MELGRRLNALTVATIIILRVLPAIPSMERGNVRRGVAEISNIGSITAMYRAIATSLLGNTSLSTRTQAIPLWVKTTVVVMLMSPITNSSFESHKAVLATRIRGG
jgi:hypothetical protein